MSEITTILSKFSAIAKDPKGQLEHYLSQGKKVIGCIPPYAPKPVIEAAGMVPFGLWGGQLTPTVAGKYNPIFTCSIMRSCMEFNMDGTYDKLSGITLPILCDTLRGMSGAMRIANKKLNLLSFQYPQNRVNEYAPTYLAEEFKAMAARMEETCDCKVDMEKLPAIIDAYNAHNAQMREFAAIANDHLNLITPTVRHHVMKSAQFMSVADHATLMDELLTALKAEPAYKFKGKRLYITGITAEPEELLDIMQENNIAVVGDDLAHESRQYRTDYPANDDPYMRLANQWFDFKGCSMTHEANVTLRGEMIIEEATALKADGVAVCLMRFCDVEEYEYPYISKMTEDAGLYSLCIEIDQSTQNNEQSRTKLQSFAEI